MTYFRVLQRGTRLPASPIDKAYLIEDDWDDWFKFNTLYSLVLFDEDGERHALGGVKIGQFGMAEGQRRAAIPERFDQLAERFFSLGQDDTYYDDLNRLGEATRDRVLVGLRDVARDPVLFTRALEEKVTGTSARASYTACTSRVRNAALAARLAAAADTVVVASREFDREALRDPPAVVGCGNAAVLRTSVPETTVDEYRQAEPREGDVHGAPGSARNVVVHPKAGAGTV